MASNWPSWKSASGWPTKLAQDLQRLPAGFGDPDGKRSGGVGNLRGWLSPPSIPAAALTAGPPRGNLWITSAAFRRRYDVGVTTAENTPIDLSGSFKAYDVRGIVGETITADSVEAVGAAFVDVLGLAGQTVLVGGDMRPSSPEFSPGLRRRSRRPRRQLTSCWA